MLQGSDEKEVLTKMGDIRIDYTNVMASAVGEENGLADEQLKALKGRARRIHRELQARRRKGELPFYELPYKAAEAEKVKKAARVIRKEFNTMVVLGIGGSALGTTALFTALKSSSHNSLPAGKRGGVRLHVADNIDPDQFGELLGSIRPKETVFNVISKSGATAETMSQFLIVADLLKKKLGRGWKKHVVVTTDEKSGPLRAIVNRFRLKSFIVPEGVGGRFTVLTPVSLLPAAAAGVDIAQLLRGAARMEERTWEEDLMKNPASLLAAIHYLLDTAKGKKITVMMPYSGRLRDVADWFRQLWAESLGKRLDLDGAPVHVGQTPVKALGATDQHSQVQLYVEGPFDKLVCFLEVERFEKDLPIPKGFEDQPGVAYLGGHSLGELMNVEKRGTEYALTVNRRPNMTIKVPEVSAHTVGQLLYLLEAATAFAGGLYKVNAFDQPGVEFGKQYTYAMMGKPGSEGGRAEFERASGVERRIL
ncbi:MAG: glucose-6-phosphate isomerase [Candidatus Nitrospinota bacterium M3_3B_026]